MSEMDCATALKNGERMMEDRERTRAVMIERGFPSKCYRALTEEIDTLAFLLKLALRCRECEGDVQREEWLRRLKTPLGH